MCVWLSLDDLRKLNAIILRSQKESNRFRAGGENVMSSDNHFYVLGFNVGELMISFEEVFTYKLDQLEYKWPKFNEGKLKKWYEMSAEEYSGVCPDVIHLASWALFTFVDIHPFNNGNGRLCRLVANHIMSLVAPFPVSCVLENLSATQGEQESTWGAICTFRPLKK